MVDDDEAARMVRRYRWHTGVLLAALAWWGFGNLYEAVVLLPLLAGLAPGSLAANTDLGSPLYYFVPVAVAVLVLVVALPVRLRHDDADRGLPGSVRAATLAAVLVLVAMALTVPMVTMVIPGLRDPAVSHDELLDTVVLWETGNAVRLILVVATVALLVRWRLRLIEAVLRSRERATGRA